MADSPPQNLDAGNQKLGWMALSLSIAGLVVPVLVALVCKLVSEKDVLNFCLALFAVLEVATLGCGIVARRVPAAKAALIISILSLIFVGLVTPSSTSRSERPHLEQQSIPNEVTK